MLQSDGTLDRRRLREQVFADDQARSDLESITHPHIRSRVDRWRARQTAPYCIYSAAILIESGMTSQVDRVLVVDAPEAEQLRRLMQRDAADEILAKRMMAAQCSRDFRVSRADDLIDNGDPARDPAPQIARLHACYIAMLTA
jgi:dephospho-CoA kinase